jgi:hypothetical protein
LELPPPRRIDALIDLRSFQRPPSRLYPREPALANHLIVAATELNTDADTGLRQGAGGTV